jgi:alkylation response protein AidB-like acyl-CoA dehydrogenase
MTPAEAEAFFRGGTLEGVVAGVEERLGRPVPRSFIEQFVQRRDEAFRTELRAIDGARDAIEGVKRQGHDVCVASQGRVEKTRLTLGLTGLIDAIEDDAIFSARMVAKPQARSRPLPPRRAHAGVRAARLRRRRGHRHRRRRGPRRGHARPALRRGLPRHARGPAAASVASAIVAATTQPILPLVPTDEEVEMRRTVSAIASDFGPKYMREKSAAEEPPTELWEALASKGFLGVNLPERYGGGGLGMSALAAVAEEISAAGCSLLLIVVSPAIVGSILVKHGTEEQREEWLPGIAAGTTRVAFAITEPDAGSNSHQISTAAKRQNGGYVLRGTKTYISGVEDAQAILVVARLRDDDGNLGLPLLALIDADAKGLERQHIPTALRAADRQWQLFLDDVEVPADRIVGGEHAGLKAAFDGLNPERIMGAAVACGAGRRGLAIASEYARERKVWNGVPIGAHQGLSHPLAQAKIELELARLMTQKAAALYDAGAPAGEPSNMAKYAAAEAAIHCVDQAIQTHGGNGFALEYGLTDMYWGVRLVRTAPVSREMILNYVAEHSLGLPRSY